MPPITWLAREAFQLGQGHVARLNSLDRHFDPPAAGQADIDKGAALAIDQAAQLSVRDGLARVQRHVVFDAASRQETPGLRFGHRHLRANRPRAAIGSHDSRQREGLAPVSSGEHVRADIVFQPGHEPAGAGDWPLPIRLVRHVQAIAGRRSRYLSSVSG